MADAEVFSDSFTINNVNNDKYDRVSRIYGDSSDNTIKMTLDINHELFPVTLGETLSLVLATTLALDPGQAKGENDSMWRQVSKPGVATLADMYDYVCYGKNYRMEGGDGETM
jgi:DNA-directed RNA polymerase I, II, and III subunit RPABC3